jgi:hypothetical protein
VLEAVGRRREGRFEITTRHRFAPTAIDEHWTVRRRGGRGSYSVAVQLPTWGGTATAVTVLRDGTIIPLTAGGARGSLDAVRGFRIDGPVSAYAISVLGRAHGTVRAVPTATEPSNPDPGPTLELVIASGTQFRRADLAVRIVP